MEKVLDKTFRIYIMKTEIKDYLHLYLGCNIMHEDGTTAKLIVVGEECGFIHNEHNQYGTQHISLMKPILRPLSDMTEEEKFQIQELMSWINYCAFFNNGRCNAKTFALLLSKGFDLFNLIEQGLAIDKNKTLKNSIKTE